MTENVVSPLQFDMLYARRPGVTRDLPAGKEDLSWVSNTATLVYGDHDAVLIDTFISVEQNQTLIEWVASHRRNVKYIYITHGHGDHFFGIKQLQEAVPNAKAIATPAVVEQSKQQGGKAYLESFWNKLFPGQVPQPQVFPEVIDGDSFEIEGHTFQVVECGFTDTPDSTALWIPDLRLVVAGDVAYNDIHMYMTETTTASRKEWIRALDQLKALNPKYVIAGHKKPGRDDDPRILDESKQYLADFNRLDSETDTVTDLYNTMLNLYPDRANPGSLWGGAKAAKA